MIEKRFPLVRQKTIMREYSATKVVELTSPFEQRGLEGVAAWVL